MRVVLPSDIGSGVVAAGRANARDHARTKHGLPLTVDHAGVPVLPQHISPSLFHALGKRMMDVTLAGLALLALAPALLLVAAAIRLTSPGPALFRQWRVGRHGIPFRIYKFRTMRLDATDATGVRQVGAGDPGVTPLGRLLRAASLDELPQLINVLLGDMSLIGPRPHAIGMLAAGVPYETLVPYYHQRHVVRPGLSGWAQANGLRGPTTDPNKARDRIDHDLAYIQNQSLTLDIKIIFLTIKREFLTGSGI